MGAAMISFGIVTAASGTAAAIHILKIPYKPGFGWQWAACCLAITVGVGLTCVGITVAP